MLAGREVTDLEQVPMEIVFTLSVRPKQAGDEMIISVARSVKDKNKRVMKYSTVSTIMADTQINYRFRNNI